MLTKEQRETIESIEHNFELALQREAAKREVNTLETLIDEKVFTEYTINQD